MRNTSAIKDWNREASRPWASALIGIAAAGVTTLILANYWRSMPTTYHSDAGQLWYAARELVAGHDPYASIGPGRPFNWPFPLLYPLPAVLLFVPFAALSEHATDIIWASLGVAFLTYSLLQTRRGIAATLLALLSAPVHSSVHVAQWAPLISGALVLPWLSGLLVAKPNLTLAVTAGHSPSRWRGALIVASVLLVASFIARPNWPTAWLHALPSATHIRAPILRPSGFLVLLCALKWRRPEARLLLAFALIPQSPFLSEAVPLLFIPATAIEQAMLWAASWIGVLWWNAQSLKALGYVAWADLAGNTMMLTCVLPCAAMIVRRPNVGSLHPAVERLAGAYLPEAIRGSPANLEDAMATP